MQENSSSAEERIDLNAEVFSEEYLPEKLPGRQREQEQLLQCLSLAGQGGQPQHAWLSGPSGSGKTVLARWCVREVQRKFPVTRSVYVNCWERKTLYTVVQAIAEELKVLGAEAQDTNLKVQRITKALAGKPLVVILDELDRPSPKDREDILYNLVRLPRTALICISAGEKAFMALEERTRSRLNPVRIQFEPYRKEEVAQMLTDRATKGLPLDSWNRNILLVIASVARGEARQAIHGLASSSQAIKLGNGGKITKKIVISQMKDAIRQQQISRLHTLTPHERLILEVAKTGAPSISSSELWKDYLRACEERNERPVAERTFSKYVKGLGEAQLLKVRRSAGRGEERMISLIK